MMRRVLAAVVLAFVSIPFFALMAAPAPVVDGPATPGQLAGGQALAEQVRSSVPPENSEIHGKLIIKSEGVQREIPIVCRVTVKPDSWETDYETAGTGQCGAERLVVLHSTNGPNQYFYAKASSALAPSPKPAPVPAAEAVIPLAGSDFSLADLGLEFLHWPVQRLLKSEMRLGEPCDVLESSNPRAAEIVRVRSDIDKEFRAPLIAAGYDAQGHVVKEYSLHGSSFKKVNGRWRLEKMDIRNKKTGSRTELKFDMNQ
ncbi:MAG: outer membrane lipoprotein-sorting protein [Limisphaerales bacterium]